MRTAWRWEVMLVLTLAAASPAWVQSAAPQSGQDTVASDWSGLMDSMDKMDSAMSAVERTGDPDVDFVRLMLPHHQAAIDMAKTQLLYGKDPQMRRLAQEIVTDQQSEMELMQLWFKQHDSVSRNGKQMPEAHK